MIGAVIAASFFCSMFFTLKKSFVIINLAFFLMGFLCLIYYFGININNNKSIDLRISDKSGLFYIGDYKGRKVTINEKNAKFKFGEIVKVKGTYKRDVDYGNGIVGIIDVEKDYGHRSDIITKMYSVRNEIYENYASNIGKDRAGVIMSLCFGDTSNLSKKDKNDLKKLGIIHAVSVSGMHMAVIYEILEKTLGLASAIIVSLFYVIFTGCLPATMRAFIMIFVLKLSIKVYKNYDGLSSLALSGILMLIFKPYYIFNIGAVLSYLATMGIMLYYKKISRMFYKLPQKLNESLSLTLSAQIFSVPYAGFVLKNFSGGFILGNLIIVPIYSVLIILGNLGGIFYNVRPIFQHICDLVYILLISCDGLIKLALKITPQIIYMSEITSVSLAFIFFSFILIKKGYKKFKYLPIIFSIGIIINSYNAIPCIECININNKKAFVVKYREYSALITNYKIKDSNQKESILNSLGVKKLVNIKDKYTLRIKNQYTIYFDDSVKIYDKGSKIADIRGDNIYYSKFYTRQYGIIKLDDSDKYSFLGVRATAELIDGKVLVLKGCEK
ncbi:membrane protein [Clostridium acetobutylicum]|nr:membrane protein [Clostridium acetobutylicum]